MASKSLSAEGAIALATLVATVIIAPVGWFLNHWYTRGNQSQNYPEDLIERGLYQMLTRMNAGLGGGQVLDQEEESTHLEVSEDIELDEQTIEAPAE
ncbi:hypothetical protein B9Z65_731 [Elsinoe australis]|uniref:Uncharacterized protein n=1 Tax=Elsinoe australis TaxID=40998 RepID=A0A2P8AJF4_9PEZI|nr:hypothetical protein B9Z65_731 [Elsinoe australis]